MPLDVARIRAVCFDVDGTLSDTDDQYVSGLSSILRMIPFVKDERILSRRLVMGFESPANHVLALLDRLGLDDELFTALSWLYRRTARRNRPMPPPIPGVTELVADLAARFPLAIVSARDEESTMAFLQSSGLRPRFKVVITALTLAHTKPYPDPVLHAARQLGVEPEACLMVGDTTVDVLSGRRAGAQTVGVLCGFGEHAELNRHGADLILSTTADLRSILAPA